VKVREVIKLIEADAWVLYVPDKVSDSTIIQISLERLRYLESHLTIYFLDC